MNILVFNKPYGVLCQFRRDGDHPCLADYIQEPGYYAAGRLDKDSEGLLILTNHGPLQDRIAHPKHHKTKTYWAQVEGRPDPAALQSLSQGITLKDGPTRPAPTDLISEPPGLWPRTPPIRKRKNIPTSWLQIQLSEGRNRQVRRMTAAVGHPTLRLIRQGIGNISLGSLLPGQSRWDDWRD